MSDSELQITSVSRGPGEVEAPAVHWGRAILAVAAVTLAAQAFIFLRRSELNPIIAVVMSVCLLAIYAWRARRRRLQAERWARLDAQLQRGSHERK